MHRREYLTALTALGGAPRDAPQMTEHTHDCADSTDAAPAPLPPLDLTDHDYRWVSERLREYYGAGPWQGWPGSGIYHLRSDASARVPASKAAIRQRADAVVELPHPDYEYDGYDCEDFAMHMYSTLTQMHPRLSVGVAFSFTADHVFNVFLTEEGVVEYEPQDGTVVTDSGDPLYEFDRGLLFI